MTNVLQQSDSRLHFPLLASSGLKVPSFSLFSLVICFTNSAMRPPIFLLAILACLTCSYLGNADENNPAPGDSNSATLSPLLVAGAGAEDLGDILNDVLQIPGYIIQNSEHPTQSNPATPSEPDPAPTSPEKQPDPIPKPECDEFGKPNDQYHGDYYTAVCCIEQPVPVVSFLDFPGNVFWSLARCAKGDPHIFIFSLSSISNFPTRSLW